MKCSHGLAFEVPCSQCFSEAMTRVGYREPKISSVKKDEPKVALAGETEGLLEELDCIQGLS